MSMKDHNRRKIRVGQIAVVCIGAALLAVGGVLAAGTPGAEALPHLHAEAVETIQGNDVKEASLQRGETDTAEDTQAATSSGEATGDAEKGMTYHDFQYLTEQIVENQMELHREASKELHRQQDAWRLILVNSTHLLDEDYAVERTKVGNGQYVDSRIDPELEALLAAAKEAGVEISIISAYRSYDRQVNLYKNKIKRLERQGYSKAEATGEAGTVVAIPGMSEHATGLALDLASKSYPVLEEEQENTDAYQWLIQHCMEYGFILRYPKDKEEITGIIYEPWHFRYVGEEHARIIMEQGLCLEEYLEQYITEEEKEK